MKNKIRRVCDKGQTALHDASPECWWVNRFEFWLDMSLDRRVRSHAIYDIRWASIASGLVGH